MFHFRHKWKNIAVRSGSASFVKTGIWQQATVLFFLEKCDLCSKRRFFFIDSYNRICEVPLIRWDALKKGHKQTWRQDGFDLTISRESGNILSNNGD